MTNFDALLQRFARHRVDFILIGGLAGIVHGSSRVTQDIDLLYSRESDNLSRLAAALADTSPYLRGAPRGLPFRFDEATIRSGLNFTLTCTLGDIDLLAEIPGGRYESLLPHSIVIEVFDVRCRCLDLPTLIRVKRAAGRPKDLEAIAELEALHDERGLRHGDGNEPRER